MTYAKYTIGFILSLLLTMAAYFAVRLHPNMHVLLIILGVLAVVQMVVQLIFFLHLGEEVGPKYKLASFVFMIGILVIVVGGSIWIMNNLNYNMMQMSPTEKTNYMMTQHDKGF
jgi:cytochrome o ubiquinol oxidase operon protein cyoD